MLVTTGLMLAVYTIVSTDQSGLLSAHTAAFGGIALALLGGFARRQMTAANPIVPLRVFRSRIVSGSNLVQALMASSFYTFFFLGSLDLERVLGYGPLGIGLAFLPVAVAMALFSVRFSAKLVMRFGPQRVVIAGQGVIVVALALVAAGPATGTYLRDLFAPMVLLGIGGGMSFPALSMLAMSDADPSDAGLASGLLNTTGQVGGAFGLAVLATLASSHSTTLIAQGSPVSAALSAGFHLAWGVAAVCVVVTIAIAVVLLRVRADGASLELQAEALAA